MLASHRAVYLGEGLEQPLLILSGDSDAGVFNFDAQVSAAAFFLGCGDAHEDLSALGELDGIGHEVRRDLTDPGGIAAHTPRNRAIDVDH